MIITKYEQSGFVLKSDKKRIAVDIGEYTPRETVERLAQVSAVIVSHIHKDHWSEEYAQMLGGKLFTVAQVAEAVESPEKLDIHIHKVGDTFKIPETPFTVTVLPSDHGPHVSSPVENTALLISDGDSSVYFLGDMFVSAAPIEQEYDAIMIPVGNNNYTFGPGEAASYIHELGWNGVTIPVHYNGKLDPKTADEFAKQIEDDCLLTRLEIGQTFEI